MAQQVQDVYNQLGSIYDPQTTLINQQLSQADVDAAAQQAALDQAKINAFKDIDISANRKGVLFSGFSPAEQATYTGTKYLPAVANLKSTVLNTKNTLMSKIASLNAERRQSAEQTVAQQIKQEQEDAYRQAQLQLQYMRASRSGGGGGGLTAYQQYQIANKPVSRQQAAQALAAELRKVAGRDGYVSPQNYFKASQAWASLGLGKFDTAFHTFRNPSNKYYHW